MLIFFFLFKIYKENVYPNLNIKKKNPSKKELHTRRCVVVVGKQHASFQGEQENSYAHIYKHSFFKSKHTQTHAIIYKH